MNGAIWVDLIILAVAVLAGLSGYRQGAVASALAFLGVIIGAVAGVLLAPVLISQFDDARLRLVVGVMLIIGLVVIGELSGMVLGRAVRSTIHSRVLQRLDSGVGSVLQVIAVLVAAWLLSYPLRSADQVRIADAVRDSRVVTAVDEVAPQWLREMPSELTELIDSSGIKEVIGPFGQTRVANVVAPDPALAELPVVQRVRPSVLKVTGVAHSCGQALEGSGFVVAPERVMTNAHVVAGTDSAGVHLVSGETLPATVVWFNSRNDVAVLDVPGLRAPALDFASDEADTSDDAILLGYPENGPYTVTPVRVRDVVDLSGPDIYNRAESVQREVYTVRGQVRSGNSGGPMIDRDGRVLGMVFGASEDPRDNTGFVLTARQVQRDLAAAEDRGAQVSTERCVSSH